MLTLTRPQRVALKQVYDRHPLYMVADSGGGTTDRKNYGEGKASYLYFRRTVQEGWGCIMVPWCGMWLEIEPDGYTHS